MYLFINNAGRLRTGWRVLLFVALFAAIYFLAGTLVRAAYAILMSFAPQFVPRLGLQDIIFRLLFGVSAILAGFICTRWIEGLPWRALGLSLHGRWLRDLFVGSLIGMGALTVAAGIATLGGGLSFSISGREVAVRVVQTLVASAVIFVVAALAEEALFRGYPLQTLARAHLVWVAILVTSLLFALAHFGNPHSVLLALVNTAMAGIWFVIGYLRTRNLWFPLGLHWSWNWALASIYGLPVSGLTHLAPYPLLRGIDNGPAWLTGGSYGIEGGVACTITLLIFTVFTWRTRWVSASPDLKQMTSQENPVIKEPLSVINTEAPA